MKKCYFLFLIWFLTFTIGRSQDVLDRKVTIHFENMDLKDALLLLKDKHLYNLTFSSRILPAKRIDRKFRRTPARQILQELLSGTLIHFQWVGKQIVLYPIDLEKEERYFTVSGFIQEAGSKEFLPEAYIQDRISGRFASSNEYGFYSLTLPAGPVDLRYTYFSYELERFSFFLDRNYRINPELNPAITLDSIVVRPKPLPASNGHGESVDFLSPSQIEKIPRLAGEPDIIRTAHFLPGVQTGTDGVGGIFVRGGHSGHNLILIDDVPVYNVSHAAGLFSIFNTSAIRSAKLIKGGFPARYGGRLSSILDIRTKEGNMETLKGEIEAGLLTGRFSLEGPLIRDKSSFFISARRSFLNWYVEREAEKLKREQGEKGTVNYKFYDLNFKLNYRFSQNDKIYLSFYRGVDQFNNNGKTSDVIGFFDAESQLYTYFRYDQSYAEGLDWGNRVGAVRWNHLFSDKLFANTTLTYSNLNLTANNFLSDSLLILQPNLTLARSLDIRQYHSSIEDVGGKVDFTWAPSNSHNVRFGGSATHHRFRPGALSLGGNIYDEEIGDILSNAPITSYEYTFYAEDNFSLGSDTTLRFNIGVHASIMDVKDKVYTGIQPRFSAYWQWSERLGLKLSGGRMLQFLHLLSSSSIGLPTDLWVPSTANIQPEEAWQAAGGFDYSFGVGLQFQLGVEAYYKKMDRLLSFSEGAFYLNNWEENVTSGKGDAYGLEFMLRKSGGRTSGWIAYSLAWSDRQFDKINLGRLYPFRYDRRHDLKLVFYHQVNNWMELSANWVLSSGFAYSLALSEYVFQANADDEVIIVRDYGRKNQYRMPYYHRFDLGVNLKFALDKKRKFKHLIHLGVYNLYNQKNPLYYALRSKYIEKNSEIREIKEAIEVEMLPILPSFSYSIKF